ncbi:alpha/beta fold hydrolase [Acerihabitans sp. TG2]|uniref:alpha/beta fold hydrolase n=1 Tax=Acerihabitans sp. TG2 TaxID=3096008 RepID=UPI002B22C033|nr:alpha/beta fold hydrolase [Acerihabitans sp. TG2]MEA9392289.1 alpha/beta fold hydrolase [Acerihabitans sp. TG2]
MKLHYRLQPALRDDGSPAVVLLHGLFGSLDNLGVLARPLQERHTTLQIDLRNHGLSPHDADAGYDAMSSDVAALLDQLAMENCIVIGHSMGGKVAMRLSARLGERIHALVVIDMAPVAYAERHHDNVFTALRNVSAAGVTHRTEAAALMREDIADPGTIQFLLKSFHQGEWRFNLEALWQNYPALINWRESAPWNGPVLFVRGEKSAYLDDGYRSAIQRQFPQARAHVVAGAGHWVHAEKPAATLRAIERFLDGLEA